MKSLFNGLSYCTWGAGWDNPHVDAGDELVVFKSNSRGRDIGLRIARR